MPCALRLQANVNYESANGTIAVLIAASSAWAEDGGLIKVVPLEVSLQGPGRRSVQASPSASTLPTPLSALPSRPAALTVLAYVDAHNDTVVVSISPPNPGVTARLVPLRTHASTGSKRSPVPTTPLRRTPSRRPASSYTTAVQCLTPRATWSSRSASSTFRSTSPGSWTRLQTGRPVPISLSPLPPPAPSLRRRCSPRKQQLRRI